MLLVLTFLLLETPAGDPASEADALAAMTYEVGASARMAKLGDEEILYPCGRVSLCAGACRDHLVAIAGGRKTEKTCPALARLPEGPGQKTRAAALARTWIQRAARQHRKAMSEASRERLDCGLGRLGLGPARPQACLAEDDRRALASLPSVAAMDQRGARLALAGFCAELEGCSGRCGEALGVLTQIDWRSLGAADGPAAPAGCPAFKSVTAPGSLDGPTRAWQFVQGQVRPYVVALCKRAAPPARAELACAAAKLDLLEGEACGPPSPSCAPRPPGGP